MGLEAVFDQCMCVSILHHLRVSILRLVVQLEARPIVRLEARPVVRSRRLSPCSHGLKWSIGSQTGRGHVTG